MDSSSFVQDSEMIAYITQYLNDVILHLSEIYKCNCENCISHRNASDLLYFYQFINTHRKMIKNDTNYLNKIVDIVKHTSSYHNNIKDTANIIFNNKQMQVISIYLDPEPFITPKEVMFNTHKFVKYYPEMKAYLLS